METIAILDGILTFDKEFMPQPLADKLFEYLNANVKWREHTTSWGVKLPRLTGYFADEGKNYLYSGVEQVAEPWNETLLALKQKVEKAAETDFNSLLLNYYRDGKDSIGWHSDNEKELVPDPIVASLTLGATRDFELKHKRGNGQQCR